MDMDGLSRKEKLALWRATKKAGAGAASASASASASALGEGVGARGAGGKSRAAKGVLMARPGAGNSNGAQGKKRAASHVSKGGPQRKPFQVDARRVREASERRVAPGTPIHSLKKRLKRGASEASKPASVPSAQAADATSAAAAAPAGASAVVPTARAQAKAKAAAAARVPVHVNGVSRSLDAARTKEVSDYLKSQISEANMLLEISGVDAARTLLADLLSCTDAARGVGELALYWAARAKLEEDAGEYREARQLLDEGEAYISMPTQQKVMTKVIAAFESRMNDREEVQVARLLEDSVGSLSLNDSAANSNSPASSAPFRYDPNDLSMDDGEESGSPRSAIKNLNFSTIARENAGGGGSAASISRDSGSAASTTARGGFSPEWMREAAGESPFPASGSSHSAVANGGGSSGSGGVATLSGVVFSDGDDSDLSVSDIDEGVIARAKAFKAEEEARKARMDTEAEQDCHATGDPDDGHGDADDGDLDGDDSAPDEKEESSVSLGTAAAPAAAAPVSEPARQAAASSSSTKISDSTSTASSSGGSSSNNSGVADTRSSSSRTMAPPPPQPPTMAMASREPRRRKGTPHPKPIVKRTTPRRGKKSNEDLSPGSFIAQVAATGKDGKRTLTPVRRSRRISRGASNEPTPAFLRKEMEAML